MGSKKTNDLSPQIIQRAPGILEPGQTKIFFRGPKTNFWGPKYILNEFFEAHLIGVPTKLGKKVIISE